MEHFLIYLLKVAVAVGVFYWTYHFLFKRSKDFVFNRFYLIGSFSLAFLIPLLTIKTTDYLSEAQVYVREGLLVVDAHPSTAPLLEVDALNLSWILFVLYGVGFIYHLVKLLHGYHVAAKIKRATQEKLLHGRKVNVSPANIRAFTFFDQVVIGKNIVHHPSLEMILDHETVHSREKHFYDILIAELLLMLQWFNPFARFQVQAIRNNLEFRADELVVRKSDKQEYLMTMLAMVSNRVKPPLFTELTSSNLKQRIIMMKSTQSHKYVGLARLALIPMLSLLLVSLSEKETVVVQKDLASDKVQELSPTETSSILQDELNSKDELIKYIAKTIKYPLEARKSGHFGSITLYATVSETGQIEEVLDQEPESPVIEIEEVVIVGYQNDEITPTSFGSQEILAEECERVIESFPKLNIPDLQGRALGFKFKFLIR
jgi:hypothetical protein